jgi:O-antigen/teichoic acid export membrane protein
MRSTVRAMAEAQGDVLRDPNRAELRSKVESGMGWKIASQATVQGARAIVVIILARLLSPHEFGLAAMVLVLSSFVISYSDFGLGLALVQRPSITEKDRSSVFWASLALGATLTGVGIAAAPLAADFYHQPRVEPLLAALSLDFFVTSLGSTQRSLLVRSMSFRALELRLMCGAVVSAVTGVILGFSGAGAWALVGMELAASVTSTILLWRFSEWRPRMLFSWASIRELGPYGLRFVGGNTFRILNTNTDNLLIGRFLGSRALGLYSLSYSVLLVPMLRIVSPVLQVLTPAFARIQHDKEALATNWIRATRFVGAIALPLTLTIAITARDLVGAVFGPQWHGAVPVVQVLSCVAAVQCLQIHDVVMQALGRMRKYLWLLAGSFALNLGAFVLGLRWGIVGVASTFAVSSTIFSAVYTVVVCGELGIRTTRFLRGIAGVLQAAALLVAVELAARSLLADGHVTGLAAVCVVTAAGLLAFVPTCAWRAPDAFLEMRQLATRLLRRRRVAPLQVPA